MEGGIPISKNKSHPQIFQYISVAIAVAVVTFMFQLIQQSQWVSIFQFILPVPVIFVSLRYSSLWPGVITVGLTTVTIIIMSGYRIGVFFLLGTGVAAIVLTVCFLQKYSATAAVSWVTLYYIALGVAFVYIQQGITFEVYTQRLMAVFKEQFVNLYESKNIAWQNLEAQFEALAHVLSVIFPLMSALSSSIIMYAVSRTILKFQKVSLVPLGQFQDWKVSEYLVWIFVLGGVLYHIEPTRIIGINILLGLVFLYYLQGCAIITYFLKQRGTTRFLQFLAYVFLFLQIPYIFVSLGLLLTGYTQGGLYLPLPAIILVASIGLANVWMDFRKRVQQVKK